MSVHHSNQLAVLQATPSPSPCSTPNANVRAGDDGPVADHGAHEQTSRIEASRRSRWSPSPWCSPSPPPQLYATPSPPPPLVESRRTNTGSVPAAGNDESTRQSSTPATSTHYATPDEGLDLEGQRHRARDDCYQLSLLAILTLGGGFLPGMSTAGQLIFFGMFALVVQGLGRTVYARSARSTKNDASKTWTIMTVITYAAMAVYALARTSKKDEP